MQYHCTLPKRVQWYLIMTEYEVTGGGQIGRFSATWPFVKLSVTPNRLEINASIGGKYVFAPDDIISFDYAGSFKPGIRINHRVANYSSNIVFSSFSSRDVMAGIMEVGFTPGKSISAVDKMEIVQLQESGGFAFKLKPIIAIIVIWNVIIVGGIAMFVSNGQKGFPVLPIQCATGFMILVCLGMLIINHLQK